MFIAFSFGAFFEGAAGFGAPVAVTAAILIGLGFKPLQASGLSLIANTAPVAFGALGTPLIALQAVTGLDLLQLSRMAGRILPFFSLLVPFWLLWAFAGFAGMIAVWPAALVAGILFAVPQFLVSNFHGPWLVDVISAVISISAIIVLLLVWHPKQIWGFSGHEAELRARGDHGLRKAEVVRAWVPWIILSILVFLWGLPSVKTLLESISIFKLPVAGLHNLVQRVPPVVAKPTLEGAIFNFNWLSASGTGIFSPRSSPVLSWVMDRWKWFASTARASTKFAFAFTICLILSMGFITKYSGMDAVLGLAFTKTGWLYPFFAAMLGWLGVALTGSDTSSNVLFGSLQKISATQVGVSPTLMAAANSCGGVMGKMIDAQSIVVASTATEWYGHEGEILRYVFFHSLALACLVGLLVFLEAYVHPFSRMVIH
jgi:lactate permease